MLDCEPTLLSDAPQVPHS